MSPSLARQQRGRELRGSLSRAYSSSSSLSSLDGTSLLRRLLAALLAVACFSAGWACRGGSSSSGAVGCGEEAFQTFSAGSSLLPPRLSRPSSLSKASSARPTDTLVVYIFANSGKREGERERERKRETSSPAGRRARGKKRKTATSGCTPLVLSSKAAEGSLRSMIVRCFPNEAETKAEKKPRKEPNRCVDFSGNSGGKNSKKNIRPGSPREPRILPPPRTQTGRRRRLPRGRPGRRRRQARLGLVRRDRRSRRERESSSSSSRERRAEAASLPCRRRARPLLRDFFFPFP